MSKGPVMIFRAGKIQDAPILISRLTLHSSAGANSLSVWTHNIRGIETMKGNALAQANGAPAAVKVYAGMRVAELYTEMQKQQLTVVSGSDPNVGVIGWMSAGGHGPLTSLYGLGADQVLELEVVTPDGLLKTVNANSNTDLFWAMRGVCQPLFSVDTMLISFRVVRRRSGWLYQLRSKHMRQLVLLSTFTRTTRLLIPTPTGTWQHISTNRFLASTMQAAWVTTT